MNKVLEHSNEIKYLCNLFTVVFNCSQQFNLQVKSERLECTGVNTM